jgi:tRNA-dihydrouridine synthase B
VMIGRAAQGRPWIFREIAHFLATGERSPEPRTAEVKAWLVEHLHDHYALYGWDDAGTGVRSARKHIGWTVHGLPGGALFRARMNTLDRCEDQLAAVADYFDRLAADHERLPRAVAAVAEREEEAA